MPLQLFLGAWSVKWTDVAMHISCPIFIKLCDVLHLRHVPFSRVLGGYRLGCMFVHGASHACFHYRDHVAVGVMLA